MSFRKGKRTSKIASVILCVILCLGMSVTAFAADDTYAITASFTSSSVDYSTEDQSVTLNMNLNKMLDAYSYEIYFKVTDSKGSSVSFPLTSGKSENNVVTINDLATSDYLIVTNGASKLSLTTTSLGTVVMTVPAKTAADTYKVELTCNAGTLNDTTYLPENIFENVKTTATLTVNEVTSGDNGSNTTSDYTVSVADDTTGVADVSAGDTVDMKVVVTGADYNAVYATVTYNSSAFQYVSSSDSDVKINSSTAGKIKLSKISDTPYTDGSTVTVLKFKALTKVKGEFEFGLESAKAQTFAQAAADAVNAKTVTDKVNIKPFTVTLDSEKVTGETTAVSGIDYTASIAGYDSANYDYKVKYTVGEQTYDAEINTTTGAFTISGDKITGNMSITVERYIKNTEVVLHPDYVTGWTLIMINHTGEGSAPTYVYNGNKMYYSEVYKASVWLIEGTTTVDDVTNALTTSSETAEKITSGYDVNATGNVEESDITATYACYKVASDFPVASNMAMYLRADLNNDKVVNVSDVNAIMDQLGY